MFSQLPFFLVSYHKNFHFKFLCEFCSNNKTGSGQNYYYLKSMSAQQFKQSKQSSNQGSRASAHDSIDHSFHNWFHYFTPVQCNLLLILNTFIYLHYFKYLLVFSTLQLFHSYQQNWYNIVFEYIYIFYAIDTKNNTITEIFLKYSTQNCTIENMCIYLLYQIKFAFFYTFQQNWYKIVFVFFFKIYSPIWNVCI